MGRTRDVEFTKYWVMLFNSEEPSLRERASWGRRGPGIEVWDAAVLPDAVTSYKVVTRAALMSHVVQTSKPQVRREWGWVGL